jgi:hypothetical protein
MRLPIIQAKSEMRVIDFIKNEDAYQLKLSTANDGVEWIEKSADGAQEKVDSPRLGFRRRLKIEIPGRFVRETQP